MDPGPPVTVDAPAGAETYTTLEAALAAPRAGAVVNVLALASEVHAPLKSGGSGERESGGGRRERAERKAGAPIRTRRRNAR